MTESRFTWHIPTSTDGIEIRQPCVHASKKERKKFCALKISIFVMHETDQQLIEILPIIFLHESHGHFAGPLAL